MTQAAGTLIESIRGAGARRTGTVVSTRSYDLAASLLSLWFLAGLYLDGWAHNNIPDLIDSFFTPWHAVMYTGVGAIGVFLIATLLRNRARGYSWLQALPRGYMPALIGFGIFAVSGGFDFVWHEVFGFEEDLEALLSPSHLMLATGAVLFTTGTLRAGWTRLRSESETSWSGFLPVLLSLFALVSVLTFMTQFANAFTHPGLYTGARPGGETYPWDISAIASVLLPTLLIMGITLLALRRWTLPTGSVTLLVTGNAAIMFLMNVDESGGHWPILIAALIGGVTADGLLAALKPSVERVLELRIFSFGAPFVLYLLFFAALILTEGIWWSIHMWLGAPFLAGVIGLGLSLLLAPPEVPGVEASV